MSFNATSIHWFHTSAARKDFALKCTMYLKLHLSIPAAASRISAPAAYHTDMRSWCRYDWQAYKNLFVIRSILLVKTLCDHPGIASHSLRWYVHFTLENPLTTNHVTMFGCVYKYPRSIITDEYHLLIHSSFPLMMFWATNRFTLCMYLVLRTFLLLDLLYIYTVLVILRNSLFVSAANYHEQQEVQLLHWYGLVRIVILIFVK